MSVVYEWWRESWHQKKNTNRDERKKIRKAKNDLSVAIITKM